MSPVEPTDETRDLCVSIFKRSTPIESVAPTSIEPRLVPMPEIRAVLFDVYGTLFSSASGDIGVAQGQSKTDCFRQTLSQIGCSVEAEKVETAFFRAIEEAHKTQIAVGAEHPEVRIEKIWHRILNEIACVDAADPLFDLRAAVEYESLANPVSPMPGLEQTIEYLARSCDVLGIVSNAQVFTRYLFDAYLDQRIEDLGIPEHLCAWSYNIGEAKPSTRIFLPLLQMLNDEFAIAPEHVLYVGNDMLNDVFTSKACGCRTALFAGDARSLRLRLDRPEWASLKPDIVLTRLEQLEAII